MRTLRRRLQRWKLGLVSVTALLLLHRSSSFQLPTTAAPSRTVSSSGGLTLSSKSRPRIKTTGSLLSGEKKLASSLLRHAPQRLGTGRIPSDSSSTSLHAIPRAASVAAGSSTQLWSWFYMGLLAVQFAMQPILVRKFTPKSISRSSFVFCHDVVKGFMSLLLLALSGHGASCIAGWSISSWFRIAFLPAGLYVIQMYCSVMAYQNLPPVTFNVLNQTKTLSAALWCYVLLGQVQSKLQIISLWILCCSAMILEKLIPIPQQQGKSNKMMKNINNNNNKVSIITSGSSGGLKEKKSSSSSSTAISATSSSSTNVTTNVTSNTHLTLGVIPVMLASLISGLAGALCQRGLQLDGRNTYLFTMEISIASIFILGITMLLNATPDHEQLSKNGFWYGWTLQTWIPVITQGLGGVFVGLVIKYCGNVRKGFALIFGLLLCGILQAQIKEGGGGGGNNDNNETKLTREQVVGGMLAAISLWMHSSFPAIKQR